MTRVAFVYITSLYALRINSSSMSVWYSGYDRRTRSMAGEPLASISTSSSTWCSAGVSR